jgi:tRNA A-37 threonylcarbamoyl transferase component Bud32
MTITAVAIKYGAKPVVLRWFEQYWTERDRRLIPWLIVCLLAGFLLVGPPLLLWLMNFLPVDQLGNSGASRAAHAAVAMFGTAFAGLLLVVAAAPMFKAKRLFITENGIRKVWHLPICEIHGPLVRWQDVSGIYVAAAKARRLQNSNIGGAGAAAGGAVASAICFATFKNQRALTLASDDLPDTDDRKVLADAIARFATTAVIQPDVFELLTPRGELSFTELWLQALSAPPGRDRLLPLEAGTMLDGKYEIVRKLGAGGQGTAYLARCKRAVLGQKTSMADNSVDGEWQDVVLKETILPVYANMAVRRAAIERFQHEAQMLSAIDHPQIVRLFGSFVSDHRAYLVMQYLQGTTLSTKVDSEGAMAVEQVVALGIQMCDLLQPLHASQPSLVHRDFTPHNLIIDENNNLMLIDFAAAVPAAEEHADVSGKIAYMAPEQFKGTASGQSDIYALGCTLHFILTGQEPQPLESCNPPTSHPVAGIIQRATALDCRHRYESVQQLRADLSKVNS